MLSSFIIAFREGIEIFLVIVPLIVFFNKNNLYEMTKSTLLGGCLGFILSGIIGGIIFSQAALLEGTAGMLFDGLLGLLLSLLILYSVVLFRKNKIFDLNPDDKYTNLSTKGVFILASITVFREMLETVLFILAASSNSALFVAAFVVLGLVCAALVVYIPSKGFVNFNVKAVFYILNIFLVCLGAYYFGDGLLVLFEQFVPEIFKIGVLIYAVPSLIIFVKNDLKKLLKSQIK